MKFRISDTFTDSLARLPGEEQKAVKTTAFDLQMNPANPGMRFHRLERARDKCFWSLRVSGDIRLIVHKTGSSLLLCYAGHHDQAYSWAEHRKLETHPRTGAAQLVEIREVVREIDVPRFVPPVAKPLLFADVTDETLLNYGVPVEWLGEAREADEDTILELAEHLPAEAAEALLNLAVGALPEVIEPAPAGTSPLDHPDAKRRFRVVENLEELERVFEYPWEKWTVFLHPAQRKMVESDYNGPARISGSAGTGKTIVALHRAVFLARTNPDARVLLTTFSNTLAKTLETKLKRLVINEPRILERIEVYPLNSIGERLYELNFDRPDIATREIINRFLSENEDDDLKFSRQFMITEWEEVVDAWQLETWEEYRDVVRLGRKTRLSEKHRVGLWLIFEQIRAGLKTQNLITYAGLFNRLANLYKEGSKSPFDYIVVDEAQDVSVAQLRFLAALGADSSNGLFFTGDLGQRIFQQPFSWKALGVDIRGRSKTLRINYRTSHQIRRQADRLLEVELSDADGNIELRNNTISVFNGLEPTIAVTHTEKAEIEIVSKWLKDRLEEGVRPHEIGVIVRSVAELDRARAAIHKTGYQYLILDEDFQMITANISICTMPLAKGLEFRAVAVMACDDEIIPLQERIETIADVSDLEEIYNTERHLLYVACTRARDYLLITGVEPVSEFLDDLGQDSRS